MTDPQANAIFAYFEHQSVSREGGAGQQLELRGLADQFGASGVGVCTLTTPSRELLHFGPDQISKNFPWQTDGKLLSGVRASLNAEPCHDPSGEWLLVAVASPQSDEPLLAWLFRPQKHWSEPERWQWTCASQALVRWYFAEGCKAEELALTQRRLESSAILTSRLIHEFGNFLTGIMGFTELAQARAASDPTLAMYLQEVMLSTNHGASWVRRLHRFCQRGRGLIWPTHLPSLLEAMDAREQAQGIKPRLQIEAPSNLPLLEIDSGSMQAILQELIDNARETSADNEFLRVRASLTEMSVSDCQNTLGSLAVGPCVEIIVSDHGPGFSAEAHTKLFRELFYSTKPRHRGTGLLAVYGIVQRFQGGVAIDNAPVGAGASVRVYLPLAKIAEPAPATAKPASVLLVHSEPMFLESMRTLLTAAGHRVNAVNAPSAAMSTFQLAKPAFNLVIAETTLPRVSGFELARRILDHHPKAQFLFLNTQSAYHDAAEEEMLRRFVVLRWPMAAAEFLKAVDKALTNPA